MNLCVLFWSVNGYDVFLAVNGRDGVNAARKQNPDLILMDLAMPEMDGWEATRPINKGPKNYYPFPYIAVTAHALPSERETRTRSRL